MRLPFLGCAMLVALALVGSACGGGNDDAADDAGRPDDAVATAVELQWQPVPGVTPPELAFEATDIDGDTVRVADYAGQDVVLWFWAPW